MRIQRQFKLHGPIDPFTLLKVSQAFRETACGESLEFIYGGTRMPEELFKVLPAAEYTVVEQDQYEDPVRHRIVIQKNPPAQSGHGDAGEGCKCG